MTRSRVTRLFIGAVALVVLSACGHQPGSAFQVGSTSVDRGTVDSVADAECTLIKGQGQAVPRAKLLWSIVNALVLSTAQIAYGDSHGTTYDPAPLRAQLSQLDTALAGLKSAQRSDLRGAISDSLKGELIALSVGRKALEDQGTTSPQDDAARAAGNKIVMAWATKQGVDIDPRYNLGKSDQAGAGDGSISKAVSSYAKSSASGSASKTFLAQLPKSQLCG
ncbi:MAG: hypothetical protein JWO46_1663 [Nocardioidaceae bacterium]|nr:hypothetical protein [Nocardioidaceae bacterium]